jgi:arylsulfatase A-like enzyme
MQKRPTLPTMALLVGLTAGAALSDAAKPNIVLLFVDDLGYADVGYNGCADIPTPHIDSIAENGVICDKGYVSAPVCAPSRAGLLTGRYQTRFGFEDTPGPFQQSSWWRSACRSTKKTWPND